MELSEFTLWIFTAYPALELFPEDDLSNWWWLGVTALGIPELLNMMFAACADGCVWIDESGRRGPNESICCRCCKNGICGCPCPCMCGWPCPWPCMLLMYAAGMLAWGMEPGTATGLGFILAGLDGLDGTVLPGRLVPAAPNRTDLIRARSAEILCLTLSTCSHSFKSKVSTSANCFNFNSNLFNCQVGWCCNSINSNNETSPQKRLLSICKPTQRH